MGATSIELNEWLECLRGVLGDYAPKHLRFDGEAAGAAVPIDGTEPAAYVAILGNGSSMHLGLSSSMEGCRALTRALLGMRQRDAISDREVVDGMSEILNILAGKVKSRLSSRDRSLQMGLPIFVMGPAGHGDDTERATVEAMVGPVRCQLLVVRQRRAS
jgi:CheY-specific phosphatase CheX